MNGVSNEKNILGGPKTAGPQTHDHNCQILTDLKTFTGRFLGTFAVKWILKVPSHLAYVTHYLLEH